VGGFKNVSRSAGLYEIARIGGFRANERKGGGGVALRKMRVAIGQSSVDIPRKEGMGSCSPFKNRISKKDGTIRTQERGGDRTVWRDSTMEAD